MAAKDRTGKKVCQGRTVIARQRLAALIQRRLRSIPLLLSDDRWIRKKLLLGGLITVPEDLVTDHGLISENPPHRVWYQAFTAIAEGPDTLIVA